jgi:hypothetical protein
MMVRGAVMTALLFGVTAAATAKDAVEVSVTPVGTPTPIVTVTGTGWTPGTFATGNIMLDYVVVGYEFPTGLFAGFNMDLRVAMTSGGRAPVYPVDLSFRDIGSPDVNMTALPNPMTVTGTGWTGSSAVGIYISQAVASEPSLAEDGAEIVGSLQLETPGGSHLDTPTTIKVRIRLVHPTSCLRMFNFISDADLTAPINSVDLKFHAQNGRLQNMTPGVASYNVLVVNTCATTETGDLKVALDSLFTTQPNNNPGNAVFTYSMAGAVDPGSFSSVSMGTGTPRGQQMCLGSLSIPAGTTLLTTVKMTQAADGKQASELPASFTFGGTLYTAASSCSGALHPTADSNPVSSSLTWVAK